MNATTATIARHRTAIRRPSFLLPIKCLLRDGLVHAETSFFDYGWQDPPLLFRKEQFLPADHPL